MSAFKSLVDKRLPECCCRWPWGPSMRGASFALHSPSVFHWTISQVTLTFTIAIMVLGFDIVLRRALVEAGCVLGWWR